MRLEGIVGFRLVCRDVDRLARFYASLGFQVDEARPIDEAELRTLGVPGRGLRRPLLVGTTCVDLDRFDPPGADYPDGAGAASPSFQHLALVAGDVEARWELARGAGASPISRDGPVTLPASSGGVTAMKFRDPEGHPLELIRFPDPVAKDWTGEGLLGIDHSAIVSTDLAASRAFYGDLGLVPGETTLNRGPGQAALDGLEDPHTDVVPLLPAQGRPHVELLRYRTPRAPRCEGWGAADVVASRFVWRGSAAALLRDPDGHLHQVEA